MKKLHASGEDYLEAVLVLQKEKGMVRSVDVAQHPGWLFTQEQIYEAVWHEFPKGCGANVVNIIRIPDFYIVRERRICQNIDYTAFIIHVGYLPIAPQQITPAYYSVHLMPQFEH